MIYREPYAHIGVADVHEEERPGLTCDDCDAYLEGRRALLSSNYHDHWSGLSFSSVPGGASVARPGGGRGTGLTPKEHIKDFDDGLHEYKDNKKAGLQAGTKKGSVEKAYKKAERNERVRNRYERGDLHAQGIELSESVARDIGAKP